MAIPFLRTSIFFEQASGFMPMLSFITRIYSLYLSFNLYISLNWKDIEANSPCLYELHVIAREGTVQVSRGLKTLGALMISALRWFFICYNQI